MQQATTSTTRREPTKAESSLVGVEFEEDSIVWVVLKLEWDERVGEMVVYYYDKKMVEASGTPLGELDDESDDVERSSVEEVTGWIEEYKHPAR